MVNVRGVDVDMQRVSFVGRPVLEAFIIRARYRNHENATVTNHWHRIPTATRITTALQVWKTFAVERS